MNVAPRLTPSAGRTLPWSDLKGALRLSSTHLPREERRAAEWLQPRSSGLMKRGACYSSHRAEEAAAWQTGTGLPSTLPSYLTCLGLSTPICEMAQLKAPRDTHEGMEAWPGPGGLGGGFLSGSVWAALLGVASFLGRAGLAWAGSSVYFHSFSVRLLPSRAQARILGPQPNRRLAASQGTQLGPGSPGPPRRGLAWLGTPLLPFLVLQPHSGPSRYHPHWVRHTEVLVYTSWSAQARGTQTGGQDLWEAGLTASSTLPRLQTSTALVAPLRTARPEGHVCSGQPAALGFAEPPACFRPVQGFTLCLDRPAPQLPAGLSGPTPAELGSGLAWRVPAPWEGRLSPVAPSSKAEVVLTTRGLWQGGTGHSGILPASQQVSQVQRQKRPSQGCPCSDGGPRGEKQGSGRGHLCSTPQQPRTPGP